MEHVMIHAVEVDTSYFALGVSWRSDHDHTSYHAAYLQALPRQHTYRIIESILNRAHALSLPPTSDILPQPIPSNLVPLNPLPRNR